jgi:argininosuccinate lyase
LVHQCEQKGLGQLKKLSLEDFRGAVAPHTDAGLEMKIGEDIYDWLGPENVVKRYQSAGNAGVSGFEAQLQSWKERLGES